MDTCNHFEASLGLDGLYPTKLPMCFRLDEVNGSKYFVAKTICQNYQPW